MNISFFYNENAIEAFRRAQDFCEEEKLTQIETLFLFKELLKEADSKLYEFFQDEYIEDDYIEDIIENCVQELVDSISKNENYPKDGKKIVIHFDDATCEFIVTEELFNILAWVISDQKEKFERMGEEELNEECIMKDEDLSVLICPDLIMNYILLYMPMDVTRFLRRMNVKISELKSFIFGEASYELDAKQNIPKEMQTFLRDITSEVHAEDMELILGRENETQKIWNIISKRNKRNAILVGEPGVGKTAIVDKMAQDIKHGKCPEKFKGYRIISLDITCLIANTTYRGQAEERFNQLNTFLEESEDVILFIDEIHTMLGAGACKDGELDLANSMKPILARGKAVVIGATTVHEYNKYFAKDGALKRRFEKVTVEEPKSKEVYPMLKNRIKDLEEYHGVTVSRELVEFAIFTAACFNYETKNPDRTLDLLDRAMVIAKNDGKKRLDKRSVLKNYDINFKRWREMDLHEKKSTAYHEAGHFVVSTMSDYLVDSKVIAVSIMPAENYLGVNVYENTDKTVSRTLEYFIDSLASDLAGRVAERMFTNTKTSGASSDLRSATKIAYEVVTKYALVNGFNKVYCRDEDINLCSEESINNISKEVDNLLVRAEKRAEVILKENEELLNRVVEELLKNKMLSYKDLTRICKSVKKAIE